MLIIRRSNCICMYVYIYIHTHTHTAFGIVTLYKWTWCPCSTQVERVLSQHAYCTATTSTYREWRYHMLYIYNLTSWLWAYYCSKHVEECNIMWIKKFCALSWYLVSSLYHNARSEEHKIWHRNIKCVCMATALLLLFVLVRLTTLLVNVDPHSLRCLND